MSEIKPSPSAGLPPLTSEGKRMVRIESAKAGGKEGTYGILAMGAAMKIWGVLPEILKLAPEIVLVPIIAGAIVAGIKYARRYIRNIMGVNPKGVL